MTGPGFAEVVAGGVPAPPDGGVHEQRFVLRDAARGPWEHGSAHGGAPAALLARAVEQRAAGADQRISALAYSFLGPVPLGEVTVRTTVRKPGRRLQIVHGELVFAGRTVMEVRAVLLRRGVVALPAGVTAPTVALAPPAAAESTTVSYLPEGIVGFHPTAIELRPLEGSFGTVGVTATAWLRLQMPVLAGEAPSGAQRAVAAADFGNGLAHPVSFDDYLFVNCDLTVAVHRDPVGEWIGLRAQTSLDGAGTGLTTTELHDETGRFGTATQTLFVAPR